jgi:hypothetical protein
MHAGFYTFSPAASEKLPTICQRLYFRMVMTSLLALLASSL